MTDQPDVLAATARVPALLEELRAWVNIDSGSHDKAGVDAVAVLVRARFAHSGFTTELVPQTEYGDHLVARRSGNGTTRLLIIGHMDTVYRTGEAAQRPFTIRDGRAYGPGVLDMKSGILAGIVALDLVGPTMLDRAASITFICNSDEELGSPSSTPLIRAEAGKADAVLVLEPTRDPRYVVVGRKGVATYTLEVTGLAAHAGNAPDSGRNAILELAHLVIALQQLHKAIPTVSLNVGMTQGGSKRNVVPDYALAQFEMRAATSDAFEAAREAIAAIVAAPRQVVGTEARLTQGATHQPLQPNEGSRQLVEIARATANTLGIELTPKCTGGASDGNTSGGMGVPTLDGLGLIGQFPHNAAEHIRLESIPLRLALLTGIIRSVLASQLTR